MGKKFEWIGTRFIVHGGLEFTSWSKPVAGGRGQDLCFIKYARREIRWSVSRVTDREAPNQIWPEATDFVSRLRKMAPLSSAPMRTLNAVM